MSVSLGEVNNGDFVIALFCQVFWATLMYLLKCITFLGKELASGRMAQNGLINHVRALGKKI